MKKTTAASLWKKTCKHLKDKLHPDVYSRWIATVHAVDLEDKTLTLGVDNDFYLNWLQEHYLTLIQDALNIVSDGDHVIKLVVDRETAKEETRPQPRKPAPRSKESTSKAAEKSSLNSRYTFSDFIVGQSNRFAHAAAQAVSEEPARAYNPLFIYGGVGLGKTHLMQAIGHHIISKNRKAKVCYISSEAFTNEYIDALQNRSLVQFRRKYRNTDLLMIDDIHFLGGKDRLQEEFFHTFNALFDAHKQIVMTCDRPAAEIPGLEQRLVSRFEWGLVTELEQPDVETRIAILKTKLDQSNMTLSDEVVNFLAENIKSNIRRLEGALIRVMSYASLTGSPLTVPSLERLLHDTLEQEKDELITFETIQRAVAEYYDVRLSDMSSKRRMQSVALPRQVAMFLCRRMTSSSFPDIANAFGKTHATVLHACRTIDNRCTADDNLKHEINSIVSSMGRKISL